MDAKQHILIIGGSSFVARNFIRLHKENYTIKVVSRSSTGFKNEVLFPDFSTIPVELFNDVDVVINCAAIVHQRKQVADEVYNKINFELAVYLTEKAKSAEVKTFIQLSTIAVYGDQTHISSPTKENPVNAYGRSKLLADNKLKNMSDEKFKVMVFRPPMIYGSTDAPGNMMRLILLIAKGFPLPFKRVTNKRDFIHIDNLIGFMDASIKKNVSGMYLVSDNAAVSVAELYDTIISCLGKKNRAFRLPAICYRTIKKLIPGVYDKLFGSLTIDIDSTIKTLGYQPQKLLKQGITEMVKGLNK